MDHSLHTAALQNAMPSDSNNQPTTLTRLCQPQYTPDKASAPDFDVALRGQKQALDMPDLSCYTRS